MDLEKIKKLREETNISLGECKKALEQAGGDLVRAREVLAEREKKLARKRKGRETGEGVIASYTHSDRRVGTLLDLRSETDFVARSEKFKQLAHDLAMQVAAMKPRFVSASRMEKEYLRKKKEEWREEFSDKPESVREEIVEGKTEKMKEDICLLSQEFIKQEGKTVREVIQGYVAEFGENIRVERFERYAIG